MMHESMRLPQASATVTAFGDLAAASRVASCRRFYHDTLDFNESTLEQRRLAAFRLIGRCRTFLLRRPRFVFFRRCAYAIRATSLEYVTLLLSAHDVRGTSEPLPGVSPVAAKARRLPTASFCTDNEQNASTFDRCAWSARPARIPTPVSPPASPRCGPGARGANEAVLKMPPRSAT